MGSTVELVRLAAVAERLRWRLMARRFMLRALLAVGGLVFLGAALVMAHMLGFAALAPRVGPLGAAAIIGGADLVVGLAMAWAAARLGPGADERTALAVRRAVQGEFLRRGRTVRLLGMLTAVLRRLA